MRALEPVSSYDDHYRHNDAPSSQDQSFVDNTSSSSNDGTKGADWFALSGAGLRGNLPLHSDKVTPFVQWGQGRKVAGLALRVPPDFRQQPDDKNAPKIGRAVHPWTDSRVDLQFDLAGNNNARQQFESQANCFGPTYQKETGFGCRVDVTAAHTSLPIKPRVSFAFEDYASSNDLGTQVDEMPIIAPVRASGSQTAVHQDYMWQHRSQSTRMFGLTALMHRRWFFLDFVEMISPVLDWLRITDSFESTFSHWLKASDTTTPNNQTTSEQNKHTGPWYLNFPWLKYLDVNWLILQRRRIGRAERYERISQKEHEKRVHENFLCNTTWRAYLARFFDNNIKCSNRYNQQGKISFWPKRVFARYWQGDVSKKELSPLNIPQLVPGERLIFDGEDIYESRPTCRIALFSDRREALRGHLKPMHIGAPELLALSAEDNSRRNYTQMADYMTTTDERGKPFVNVKSSATTQDYHSLSTSALMIERLLNGSQNWQTSRSRTCTAESAYPQHMRSPRAGKKLTPNPLLADVPNHYRDPIGLVQKQLDTAVSEEAAAQVLRDLRAQAVDAGTTGAALCRDDKYVQFEELHTSPQTITSLKASLSPDNFGRLLEWKSSFAYGTRARASYDDSNKITTEKEVFGRASTEAVQPKSTRKTVEVRSAIKGTPDGRDVIDGLTFSLDLKFPEGHSDQEVNSELEGLGKLYKNGRPFHLLPIDAADQEAHGHPKVARDICLTAQLDAAWLQTLRAKLQTPEAALCANTFGIDPKKVTQLATTGFKNDDFDEKTLAAVMLFVCQRAEPKIALQFLQELCGGTWFATAPRSGTNRAGRIAKEVSDFRNELSLPINKNQPSTKRSIENLARIEAFRQRANCSATTDDVYTSDSAQSSERRVLRTTDTMLTKLTDDIDKAGPKRALLDHGIKSVDDLLAAQNIKLHTDLKAERDRLKKEPKSGRRDLRLQEIAAMLLQMGHSKAAA